MSNHFEVVVDGKVQMVGLWGACRTMAIGIGKKAVMRRHEPTSTGGKEFYATSRANAEMQIKLDELVPWRTRANVPDSIRMGDGPTGPMTPEREAKIKAHQDRLSALGSKPFGHKPLPPKPTRKGFGSFPQHVEAEGVSIEVYYTPTSRTYYIVGPDAKSVGLQVERLMDSYPHGGYGTSLKSLETDGTQAWAEVWRSASSD